VRSIRQILSISYITLVHVVVAGMRQSRHNETFISQGQHGIVVTGLRRGCTVRNQHQGQSRARNYSRLGRPSAEMARWILEPRPWPMGSGGCQTVVGRIERKRFGAVFSSARVRRTINVQGKRDCGAFGPLLPDAESVSYVLSTRWSSSNPPIHPGFVSPVKWLNCGCGGTGRHTVLRGRRGNP
jgi:hypothetical protein